MATSTPAGRLDVAEPDVEAVAEEQRVAVLEVGRDRLGVDGALHLVGGEDDDEVGLLHRLGDGQDPQALGLGLGAAPAALGQADAHVDARVAQVQRVGVALAAVADDGDLAPLDHGQVGIVVVEHLGHGGHSFVACFSVSYRVVVRGARGQGRPGRGGRGQAERRARSVIERAPRPTATMPECTSSLTPKGSRTFSSASSLSPLPVASMTTASWETSTTLARNSCTVSRMWRAGGEVGPDLDQQDLALHRGGPVELDDLDHLDQLVELLGDLLQRQLLDVDHDGHPRDLRVLGRAHGEGVDVEAAAGEQAGDPGEDAGLVLDQDGQGVLAHAAYSSRSHTGAMPRAFWILSLLTPAGTIGHTMASRCTTKSTTTGTSLISMALAIVASMSSGDSQRRPTQP